MKEKGKIFRKVNLIVLVSHSFSWSLFSYFIENGLIVVLLVKFLFVLVSNLIRKRNFLSL